MARMFNEKSAKSSTILQRNLETAPTFKKEQTSCERDEGICKTGKQLIRLANNCII